MPHPTTEPHGAHPTHIQPPWHHGDIDVCAFAGCGATIEYLRRDQPAPGQPAGGWRHVRPTCARCGEKLTRTEGGGWEHDLVPPPGHPCHSLPPEVTR